MGITFNVYITFDMNLALYGAISDKEILADVLNKKGDDLSNKEEGEPLEAEEMLTSLSSYALRHLH